MIRRLALAAGLLLSLALSVNAQGVVGPASGPAQQPGWVFSGAASDCDFANGRYYNCQIDTDLPITRTGIPYAPFTSGLYVPFAANVPPITDQGYYLQTQAVTNFALWARDWTNAAWTAASVTTALNGTGIDGAANSATRLTSTGANGTVLQTVTQSSNAKVFSVFVKRVTGSGNIDLTLDNGAGWTTCSGINTTTWTRCFITQTQLNPTFGVRIVTSGDVVLVDFGQLEQINAGNVPCLPILTTTASAGTGLALSTLTGRMLSLARLNAATVVSAMGTIPTVTGAPQIIGSGSSTNNYARITGFTLVRFQANSTDSLVSPGGSLSYQTSAVKTAFSWSAFGESITAANATVVTGTNIFTPPAAPIWLGSNNGSSGLNGFMSRVTFWNYVINDAQLKALSVP